MVFLPINLIACFLVRKCLMKKLAILFVNPGTTYGFLPNFPNDSLATRSGSSGFGTKKPGLSGFVAI